MLAEFFDEKDPFRNPLASISIILKDFLLHSHPQQNIHKNVLDMRIKSHRIGDYRLKLLSAVIALGKASYFWIDYALVSSGLLEILVNIHIFILNS